MPPEKWEAFFNSLLKAGITRKNPAMSDKTFLKDQIF